MFPEAPTGKCPRRCPQHRPKGTGPQSGPLGGRRRTTTPPLSIYRATVKTASSPPYQATPETMPTAPSESSQAPTCTGPRIRLRSPLRAVDRHRGALHDARMGDSLPDRRVPAVRDPRPGGGASACHRRGTAVPSVPRPTPRSPSAPPSRASSPPPPAPSCCGSWPIWPDAPRQEPEIFARNLAKLLGFCVWVANLAMAPIDVAPGVA